MKKLLLVIYIFSIFYITSCTLYKKPEVPSIKMPNQFKPTIKITNAKLKEKWWENFHDAELNRLVELAVINNYSYQIALKNIQIACTYVTQNLSGLFPQVNLGFNSTRNKFNSVAFGGSFANPSTVSSNTHVFNLQQLNGTVAYQVDIWNQIRNSVNQAKANQDASIADSNVMKLTLITSVVDTYFQIVTLNANLHNLNEQYKLANEIVRLINTQFQSGLIDASALDNAKNQAETIKININNLKKQKEVLQYTLAYLLGEYPEHFKLGNNFKSFQVKNLVPPSIPAEMMANRPDIQEAYYQILSYGYLEKQNIANFLPNISLTGNYGYESTALSNLLSSANTYWTYGLYATQFVFDYQTRMSEYRRSKYQYESAILNFKNTVLNAFKEVDSALSSYKEDNEALIAYQKQTVNSKDLLGLANSQYRSGLIDYSTYLTTNLSYLQSSFNVANQKLVVAEDIFQIYKTLGLGLYSHTSITIRKCHADHIFRCNKNRYRI